MLKFISAVIAAAAFAGVLTLLSATSTRLDARPARDAAPQSTPFTQTAPALAAAATRRLASVMNMNLARCQCEEIVRQAASTIKGARLRLFAVIPDRSQRGNNARRARQGFAVRFDLAVPRAAT
jgi:hypothetical protein